jgi:hypothetical protein
VRLHTYIIPFDTGFAPNPFFGYCTLACCKPAIRRAAQPGDWIVGLTPKDRGNRVVYAMHVAEKITFADYWRDPRFALKRPDLRSRDLEQHCGDNIYEPIGGGSYRQHAGAHGPEHQEHDLGGEFVLVASDYAYFGMNAVALPPHFTAIVPGRAHRCKFPADVVESFVGLIAGLGFGDHGRPAMWPPPWFRSCAVATESQPVCPPTPTRDAPESVQSRHTRPLSTPRSCR